jgi:hypothetical protein
MQWAAPGGGHAAHRLGPALTAWLLPSPCLLNSSWRSRGSHVLRPISKQGDPCRKRCYPFGSNHHADCGGREQLQECRHWRSVKSVFELSCNFCNAGCKRVSACLVRSRSIVGLLFVMFTASNSSLRL